MPILASDREILRTLAAQVAEIAALPAHRQTIDLWKRLNGLKPGRPMFTIDQVPWHEMNVDDELTLRCQSDVCRWLETRLRHTIYAWRHMPADMAVEPFIEIPKAIRGMGFGLERQENLVELDPKNDVVGHYYLDQLADEKDLEKIQPPDPWLDEQATARAEADAHEIFDGLLEVRMQGALPTFAPWDLIVQWHGVENLLYDMADRPDFLHRMVKRLTDAAVTMLDRLEQRGLLGHGQSYIHCTGAWTDELPAPGFNPAKPRARDLWTFGMAQIFSTVSAQTHAEFEAAYISRWFERFGLGYYGCCEPLHEKIDVIRTIPNVRKISMSPWVDVEKGAERLGKDYVFSRKPSPALLAVDTWDPSAVEKDLRQTINACRRTGSPLELILKDISTVRYQPQRLWEWSALAARLVRE